MGSSHGGTTQWCIISWWFRFRVWRLVGLELGEFKRQGVRLFNPWNTSCMRWVWRNMTIWVSMDMSEKKDESLTMKKALKVQNQTETNAHTCIWILETRVMNHQLWFMNYKHWLKEAHVSEKCTFGGQQSAFNHGHSTETGGCFLVRCPSKKMKTTWEIDAFVLRSSLYLTPRKLMNPGEPKPVKPLFFFAIYTGVITYKSSYLTPTIVDTDTKKNTLENDSPLGISRFSGGIEYWTSSTWICWGLNTYLEDHPS